MNQDLAKVINLYQTTVAELFPRVSAYLNVELPITNRQWTEIGANQRGTTADGIKYYIHGYGIAMNDGDIVVDFDLGIDGVDPWRLWSFIDDNNIDTTIETENELKELIEEAVVNKELIYSGYILYYLCK